MTSHNEIFGAFVEAQKALEELPSARQKISELEQSLAVCHDTTMAREHELADVTEALRIANEQLTQVRKERDDASFRELQVRDNLESVLNVLKSAASSPRVKEADELLNPLPVAPTSTAEPATGTDTVEQSYPADASGQSSAEGSSQSSQFSADNGPFASETSGMTTHSDATGGSDPGMSGYASKDDRPSEAQSGGPFVGLTAEGSRPAQQGAGSTQSMTPKTTDGPSEYTDIGSNAQSPADASPNPYEGRYYWMKPSTMTWREWESKGGRLPGWVENMDAC